MDGRRRQDSRWSPGREAAKTIKIWWRELNKINAGSLHALCRHRKAAIAPVADTPPNYDILNSALFMKEPQWRRGTYFFMRPLGDRRLVAASPP